MEVQESQQPAEETQVQEYGPGGVPKGATTDQYYRTKNIPNRFNNPGGSYLAGNPVFSCMKQFSTPPPKQQDPDEWFQGYGQKPQNPMYRTTANTYGTLSPTVHTMPTSFHGKSQKFSQHLGTCGMYRNHSVNTEPDKSKV